MTPVNHCADIHPNNIVDVSQLIWNYACLCLADTIIEISETVPRIIRVIIQILLEIPRDHHEDDLVDRQHEKHDASGIEEASNRTRDFGAPLEEHGETEGDWQPRPRTYLSSGSSLPA